MSKQVPHFTSPLSSVTTDIVSIYFFFHNEAIIHVKKIQQNYLWMSADMVALINNCFHINDTKDLLPYQVFTIPNKK